MLKPPPPDKIYKEDHIQPTYFLSDLQDYVIKNRPPLGVIPEWLWKEQRLSDLHQAAKRYREANYAIPKEFENEINELATWLTKRAISISKFRLGDMVIRENIFKSVEEGDDVYKYAFRIIAITPFEITAASLNKESKPNFVEISKDQHLYIQLPNTERQ